MNANNPSPTPQPANPFAQPTGTGERSTRSTLTTVIVTAKHGNGTNTTGSDVTSGADDTDDRFVYIRWGCIPVSLILGWFFIVGL